MCSRREGIVRLYRGHSMTSTIHASSEGIWMSAEYDDDPYFMDDLRIFDYYQFGGGDSPYDGGVLSKFKELLKKHGWYLSWNDPGTIALFPLYDNTLSHKLSPEDY